MKKAFFALLLVFWIAPTAFAALDANQHFAYIQELYDRHDKKLYDYLITEIAQFSQIYPGSEHVAEAHYLAATLYEEMGREHEAFAAYLQILALHPNSTRYNNCKEAILRVVAKEGDLRERQAEINGKLNEAPATGEAADRYLNYLQFCRSLNISKLTGWLLAGGHNFLERYPSDPHIDAVLQLVADLHREHGDEHEAAAAYFKLEYLTPESDILPYARYQRATLLYEKLDEPDKAFALFTQIAQHHPETPFAAKALFLTGEIKEKKHKDYSLAIVQYRLAVDTYPEGEDAVEALWRIAELNIGRLDNYVAGIGTFLEIAEKHPNAPRAKDAVEEAASVYEKKLRDYENAAKSLALFAEKFPEDEKAPEHLFGAGDLMKNEQKDAAKAIAYYEQLITKYPDHRRAEKARDEIAKLREKMGEQN